MDSPFDFINKILENVHYRIELHCIVSEDMHLPKHVKDRFGIGNGIVLVINSKLRHNLEIEGDCVYWDTSFNQVPYTVKVCLKDIVAIIDTVTNTGVQVSMPPEHLEVRHQPPEPHVGVKHGEMNVMIASSNTGKTMIDPGNSVTKPTLVVSNKNYNKTPPIGKLKLVTLNGVEL